MKRIRREKEDNHIFQMYYYFDSLHPHIPSPNEIQMSKWETMFMIGVAALSTFALLDLSWPFSAEV